MGSSFGKLLEISIFGESHGDSIGVTFDGFPSGVFIDDDFISTEMARRAGGGALATKRKETDIVQILSGVYNNKTTGAPICAVIKNTDTRSSDYSEFIDIPRPSHADYTGAVRYENSNDIRGGGHFSGRLTAPMVFAGALCKLYLKEKGIAIGAHLYSVGNINDTPFDGVNLNVQTLLSPLQNDIPVLSQKAGDDIKNVILAASKDGDSIGGIVECAVLGIKCGIGNPIFDGVENILASLIFGIPAVKGVEFGAGMSIAKMYGSEANDAYRYCDDKIETKTNNNGGILGGITTGMPIIVRAAFKPTPSISKPQKTLNIKTKQETELVIGGRHDPCIAIRAVPVVEAAVAIGITELLMEAAAYE